ncbi:DUF2255 family protein [Kineosporia mesophila]|nr:DUF2255 family protein [Kineosporia mesophila]MCD5352957.1 DUF2255 family protein [Kineosporia mesophila]
MDKQVEVRTFLTTRRERLTPDQAGVQMHSGGRRVQGLRRAGPGGGPENGWFRRAEQAGRGRIQVAGRERDVLFQTPPDQVHEGLDATLHAKYDHYGPGPVGAITGPQARPGTLRVVPLDAGG